jgi:3-oxoacyl-[acyl-carrier-protein] synthase-3
VNCACASFPNGLSAASGIIAANLGIKTVLVIGVYLMHKLATAGDPMVFFYGDGAGAAVLEPAASPGFITSTFRADGSYYDYWGIYSGGTFEPASEDSVKAGRTMCTIKNRYPSELNEETWPDHRATTRKGRWL